MQQAQRRLGLLRDQQRGAVDRALRAHRLVVLEEELRDLDVLLHLVVVVEHADARVERDAREHLRRLRPLLLLLVDRRQLLADHGDLLLEGDDTQPDLVEREEADLLALLESERTHRLGELEHHRPRHRKLHVLRDHVLHEGLQLRDGRLGHVVLQDGHVPLKLELLVSDAAQLAHQGADVRHGLPELPTVPLLLGRTRASTRQVAAPPRSWAIRNQRGPAKYTPVSAPPPLRPLLMASR